MMEVNGMAAIACFVAILKGHDLLDLLPGRGCQTTSVIVNKVEIIVNVRVYDGI